MSKRPPLTIWEALGTLAGLGFTIAVPIAVFTIGGYYLDGYTHTKPLFILLGLLLGNAMVWLAVTVTAVFTGVTPTVIPVLVVRSSSPQV